jgi:Ni,Fe-hydrogenase III small subunit/Pyruvate/2-oxoacid:ferredoxin oxidoreductase delta subunit
MGLVELKKIFSPHQSLDFDKASFVNANARGIPAPIVNSENSKCDSCKKCSTQCPTSAIQVLSSKEIQFDYGACLQCGICEDVCPENIIKDTGFNYVFSYNRDTLKIKFTNGQFTPLEDTPTENIIKFHKLTSIKGMKYREVAAAGNNSVECELNASFNNFFDSEGNQASSVASPKHADAIVYSGPVSKNMEGPLQTAWDCMPEPKALVAAGTEAISGGLYPIGKLPSVPDLYIGGDPPRPDVMINGFRFLMGKWKFSFQHEVLKRIQELRAIGKKEK